MELRIDQIRRDGGTQPRAYLDHLLLKDYVEAMLNGDQFPPVEVFHDGENYWLVDGFHRVFVAGNLGRKTIEAKVHQGSLREAILYSAGVNTQHGMRRSRADKYRAVRMLLNDEEWGQWSDNEIARHCKVSHPFVGKVRLTKHLELKVENGQVYFEPYEDDQQNHTCNITSMKSEERTFIHPKTGQPTTMNTAKIGRPAEPLPNTLELKSDPNPYAPQHTTAATFHQTAPTFDTQPEELARHDRQKLEQVNQAIQNLKMLCTLDQFGQALRKQFSRQERAALARILQED